MVQLTHHRALRPNLGHPHLNPDLQALVDDEEQRKIKMAEGLDASFQDYKVSEWLIVLEFHENSKEIFKSSAKYVGTVLYCMFGFDRVGHVYGNGEGTALRKVPIHTGVH